MRIMRWFGTADRRAWKGPAVRRCRCNLDSSRRGSEVRVTAGMVQQAESHGQGLSGLHFLSSHVLFALLFKGQTRCLQDSS